MDCFCRSAWNILTWVSVQARRDDLARYSFFSFGPYFQLPPGRPFPAGGKAAVFGGMWAEAHEQAEV